MVKQGVAQIGNQALANGGAKVVLSQANQGINQGNTDPTQGQPIQPSDIAVGNRPVNQVSIEQGWNQAQAGDSKNRNQ